MMTTTSTPLFETTLSGFLTTLTAKNRSAATLRAYHTDINQFLRFVEDTDSTVASPADIDRTHLADYLADLGHQGVSGVSRARKMAALREYFRYLIETDVLTKSPATGIATPKKERTVRGYLRPEEYTKLLSLAGGHPRDYALLQVFLQTGLRVSELCALTLDDLDFAGATLHVRVGKGQTARDIPLEKKAIQALKSYLAVRPHASHQEIFLNYTDEPISERGVRKLVTKYVAAAGITKRVSCHGLRHTFATQKAEKGVSAYQLQAWLGHQNLATTQIYVHLGQQNAKKAMEATSL